MIGLLATDADADYSSDPVGVIGPYTTVTGLKGLFDLTGSHARSRFNHAEFGSSPCLVNRAAPPTWAADHVATTAVGQIIFPDGPLHDSDNTIFAIFEAHRVGGALPQSPVGLSVITPQQRGQLMIANGSNHLRFYTYTKTDPNNFGVFGTQRYATYQYPTNGSLDNQMIMVVGVFRNGAGLDLYIPGVNAAAPVGALAITAADRIFFGAEAAQINFHDLRYKTSAYIGSTEKVRCFGYAHKALTLAEVNQLHTDLTTYYSAKSMPFI